MVYTAVQAILFIYSVAFSTQDVFAQMGPLDLDVLDAGNCEPKQYVSFELSTLSDDQKGLSVNFSLPFDLDETLMYSVVVDRIEDDEVQEGIFRYNSADFCNDVEEHLGDLWIKLASEMGMDEGCPKKEGSYYADKFPIDYDDIKLEKFLYGRFIANVEFTRLGELLSCVYLEFTNTPPDDGTP